MVVETAMFILIWKHYTIYTYTETLNDTCKLIHFFLCQLRIQEQFGKKGLVVTRTRATDNCRFCTGCWGVNPKLHKHWVGALSSNCSLHFLPAVQGVGGKQRALHSLRSSITELHPWAPIILSEAKLASGNGSFLILLNILSNFILAISLQN